MVFKVASLRNVAMTAPYFHNGRVTSLDEAVRQMAHYQRGRQLNEQEVRSIVAWLGSLSGVIRSQYVREPTLPAGRAN
jgi:cytochrome c peroxidase